MTGKKKTIGIIGGMGPLSTIQFYTAVIAYCQDELHLNKNNEYPHLIISNLPVPDLINSEENTQKVIAMISAELLRLEKAGAEIFALACNTVHLYIDSFRNALSHPIFSVVEETVRELQKREVKKILLLATPTTVKKNLYQSTLNAEGIEVIVPSQQELVFLGEIIPHLVGKTQTQQQVNLLNTMIDSYVTQGIDSVLLACSELRFGIQFSAYTIPIIDTMSILARKVTDAGLSIIENNS